MSARSFRPPRFAESREQLNFRLVGSPTVGFLKQFGSRLARPPYGCYRFANATRPRIETMSSPPMSPNGAMK